MNWQFIPLDRAHLCLNCGNVVDAGSGSRDTCPICALKGLMSIQRSLDAIPIPYNPTQKEATQ